MDEIQAKLASLQQSIKVAIKKLSIETLEAELKDLQAQAQTTDFWSDNLKAQVVMKRIASLEAQVKPWRQLEQDVAEAQELASLKDGSLAADLHAQTDELQARYDQLKQALRFTGPYDDHDALVSIHAGAGGTEAQDWTQMLFRMYGRWAEKNSYDVSVIDESAGEEAGLKRVTVEVSGPQVYGHLKSEHGVHRLVRLSPFNADHLRQTSFAKVEVMPKIDQPDEVAIDDKDLKIDVYRSGGHGGQSVNTTDSAVRVTHLPTGITVAIQNERSQLQNKDTALTILRSRLAQMQLEQHADHLAELKGPNQSAEWGNQIRSYVLHPYKMVKDLRTNYETSDPDAVLDGDLNGFINAYLEHSLGSQA